MPSISKVSAKSSVSSTLGTPAQHSQPSRKGKRAWRKNVDIDDVEEGLEGLRAEERVTGSILQKKGNDELFQIDLTGDEKVRKSLPRFNSSQLTSAKILAQRSAVPAVFARPSLSSSNKKPRSSVSREDKARLLRIGKRKRLGPLNSVMDPTELGSGSAMLEPSHAAKESGAYDVWGDNSDAMEDDKFSAQQRDFLPSTAKKAKTKPPQIPHPRSEIDMPAIVEPHQGASYNPPVQAHQDLLRRAHEIAEGKEKDAEKYAGVRKAMEAARRAVDGHDEGVALGMTVDEAIPDEDDVGGSGEGVNAPAKLPARKTKQQRQKAARLRAEKRALIEKAAKKRMLNSISAVKSMRLSIDRSKFTSEQARTKRQLALRKRMKEAGLAGQRLGKHEVQEGEVVVQLGDELSESLRGLKPEGNLFRDRFLSLQHRALVEPRVPVLPKRRRANTKEVEKHAWKRFE